MKSVKGKKPKTLAYNTNTSITTKNKDLKQVKSVTNNSSTLDNNSIILNKRSPQQAIE